MAHSNLSNYYQRLILFAIILTPFAPIYGQQHKDLGVGTFTLKYFYYPNKAPTMDTLKNVILKRIIYVKHGKYLTRQIPNSNVLKIDSTQRLDVVEDRSVKSTMRIKLSYPTFLTNLDKETFYMYYESTKNHFYFQDTLDNHPESIYPRTPSKADKIIYPSLKEFVIAGKSCMQGLAITGKDTSSFYYTKDNIDFESPIRIEGVIKPILGINSKYQNGELGGLFIVFIKKEELPDSTFTLPQTSKRTTKENLLLLN